MTDTADDTTTTPEPADEAEEAYPGENLRVLATVRREEPSGALAIRSGQVEWTEPQLAALAQIGMRDVPAPDLVAFLHRCQKADLDPFLREIYLIGRNEKYKDDDGYWRTRTRYTAQTGIDGFRTLAERTGEYDGQLGPFWCGPDGEWRDVWLDDAAPPVAAKVGVLRRDRSVPTFAVAKFSEYAVTRDEWEGSGNSRRPKLGPDGKPVVSLQGFWAKMPANQIAKCAEALAIRKTFPRQTAGLYTTEEMQQADAAQRRETEAAQRADAAKRRADLRGKLGPGENATPAETAESNVVEGEIVKGDGQEHGVHPYEPGDDQVSCTVCGLIEDLEAERLDPIHNSPSREALLVELRAQADALGQKLTAMTRRWVAAHRKNVEDATGEELYALVATRREQVAKVLSEQQASDDVENPGTEPAGGDDTLQRNPGGTESARGASDQPASGSAPAPPAADDEIVEGEIVDGPGEPEDDQPPVEDLPPHEYRAWGKGPDAPCVDCMKPKSEH